MATETAKVEEKDDDNKVVDINKFRALPGGKGPEGANWLKEILPPNAFIFRLKPHGGELSIGCQIYQVLEHREKVSILYDGKTDNRFMVHTWDFSRAHEWLETHEVHRLEATEEETKDGTSNPD